MHPENTPAAGALQLFVQNPKTGDTVPMSVNLGHGDTLAEFTVQDTTDEDELYAKAAEYLKQLNQAEVTLTLEAVDLSWLQYTEKYIQPMIEADNEWLAQIVIEQEQACIKWAKEHRRKWLHIGRTTKKARTRKKYARLIWRDYKAARAAALARIAREG